MAQHSEDKIIEYCQENIDGETTKVTLSLVSDNTGNKVENEGIDNIRGYSFEYLTSPIESPLPIYDAYFDGYYGYTGSGYTGYFVTKTDGSINFALDDIGDYDIPVD